jgi:hypothetical protein
MRILCLFFYFLLLLQPAAFLFSSSEILPLGNPQKTKLKAANSTNEFFGRKNGTKLLPDFQGKNQKQLKIAIFRP